MYNRMVPAPAQAPQPIAPIIVPTLAPHHGIPTSPTPLVGSPNLPDENGEDEVESLGLAVQIIGNQGQGGIKGDRGGANKRRKY